MMSIGHLMDMSVIKADIALITNTNVIVTATFYNVLRSGRN